MNRQTVFFLFLLMLVAASCTEQTKEEAIPTDVIVAPINPNGDSELALLMRDMFDNAMQIKEQVKNGEKPTFKVAFDEIHSATSTDPADAKSDRYAAFAQSFSSTLKTLENASADDLDLKYNQFVGSCMNCHQAMCPGPMVRIKKLYLPKKG